MKSLGLGLIVLSIVLAFAPLSGAQETGKTTFNLTAHTDGSTFYFADETGAKNPTLVVPANTEITVTITNVGSGVHNFCFGSTCSEYVQADGDTQTLKFNSGATGGTYHCLPHKSSGMGGDVRIAGTAATTTTTDDKKESPGFEAVAVLAGLAGAVLLLRRK